MSGANTSKGRADLARDGHRLRAAWENYHDLIAHGESHVQALTRSGFNEQDFRLRTESERMAHHRRNR